MRLPCSLEDLEERKQDEPSKFTVTHNYLYGSQFSPPSPLPFPALQILIYPCISAKCYYFTCHI